MTAVIGLERIVIDEKAISEVVGATPLVRIPRSDLRRVRLRFGAVTERVWFPIVAGVVAVAIGMASVCLLIDGQWVKTGGLGAMFLIGGPWLILSALKHGPFLEIHTDRTVRRLGFGAKPSAEQLRAFVEEAREQGLEIEIEAVR